MKSYFPLIFISLGLFTMVTNAMTTEITEEPTVDSPLKRRTSQAITISRNVAPEEDFCDLSSLGRSPLKPLNFSLSSSPRYEAFLQKARQALKESQTNRYKDRKAALRKRFMSADDYDLSESGYGTPETFRGGNVPNLEATLLHVQLEEKEIPEEDGFVDPFHPFSHTEVGPLKENIFSDEPEETCIFDPFYSPSARDISRSSSIQGADVQSSEPSCPLLNPVLEKTPFSIQEGGAKKLVSQRQTSWLDNLSDAQREQWYRDQWNFAQTWYTNPGLFVGAKGHMMF